MKIKSKTLFLKPFIGKLASEANSKPVFSINALRITNNTVLEGFKRNVTLAAKKYTFSFFMNKGLEDLNDKEYFSVDILNSANAIVYTYTAKVNATGYYNFDYTATTAGTYTWRFRRVSLNGRSTAGTAYFDDFKVSYNTQQSQQVCSAPKNYRFGFNTQEKDDEVYGAGNLNTAEFWEYDTRIGRRWNIDPVHQINISDYAAFRNNPIIYVDPNGDKVINGDQVIADNKKEEMNKQEESIKNLINEKDEYTKNGNEKLWEENMIKYKADYDKLKAEYNKLQDFANNTQSYINKWKVNSGRVFESVDKESVDFIIFNKNLANEFGVTIFKANEIEENKFEYICAELGLSNAQSIFIDFSKVKVDVPDCEYVNGREECEYTMNHEAGHFLYQVRNTTLYFNYLKNKKNNNLDVGDGHLPDDLSGRNALRLGREKNPIIK